jgi:hypothetical protein
MAHAENGGESRRTIWCTWTADNLNLRDRRECCQGFASEAEGSNAGHKLLDGLQLGCRLTFTNPAEGRTIHAVTIVPD